MPEWSIQGLAKAAGTTSRTLRHYGSVGLLEPSRVGSNGYRYYDQDSLVRLQRILLLRELGLGLPAIAEVFAGQQDTAGALRTHLRLLEQERERIGRQILSVRTTLRKTEGGEALMASEVFDGFDHTQYKDEVEQRWGKEAYASGDRWWRGLSDAEKRGFMQTQLDIASDYGTAFKAGLSPESDEAQAITARHAKWLGIATQGNQVSAAYLKGLGQMYVDDPRFRKNYDEPGGSGTAEFVRDAMAAYAERHLT